MNGGPWMQARAGGKQPTGKKGPGWREERFGEIKDQANKAVTAKCLTEIGGNVHGSWTLLTQRKLHILSETWRNYYTTDLRGNLSVLNSSDDLKLPSKQEGILDPTVHLQAKLLGKAFALVDGIHAASAHWSGWNIS